MTVRTRSAALTGMRAHLVEIETSIRPGLPGIILTGLPDTALRETRDRVRAAIVNSGQPWPGQIITTRLYPASPPGHGSALDAAIAVGILAAAGLVPGEVAAGVFWFAELGLDGRLRPVRGVLPALAAAQSAGCRVAVVAPGNAAEAALADGVTVTSMQTLAEVITWLREDGPAREVISLPASRNTHGAVTGGSTVADPARDDTQQTAAAAARGDNVTTARSGIAEPPRTVNRLPVVDWRPRPAGPGELPGQFYVACLRPDATGDRPFIVWTVAYDPCIRAAPGSQATADMT